MNKKTVWGIVFCVVCLLCTGLIVFAESETSAQEPKAEAEPAAAPEAAPEATPEKAACELTYDNFGKKFLETYCLKCHSSTKTGFSRWFAPKGSDFDKLEVVMKEAGEIVEYVADKKKMPTKKPKPTGEEREQVRQWIECEYAEAEAE